MSYSRQALEQWLKTIEVKRGKVLDVGNAQKSIKGRVKLTNINELVGLDLETPHEGITQDIVCDLNYPATIEKKYKGYFNTVFCLEVSEYWWNPYQALLNINGFLEKRGKLYLSFHLIYPCHNPIEQDYLRYTSKGVEKLLRETGFEILEMRPRLFKCPEVYKAFYTNEGMRPAREYDKHSWQGCLVKAKKK